jgi:hypothetical protein
MKTLRVHLSKLSLLGKVFVLFILTFCAGSSWAEDIFVTGYIGGNSSLDKVPFPLVDAAGFAGAGASAFSTSTASPSPTGYPSSQRRIMYGNSITATWRLSPYNITLTNAPGQTFTNIVTFRELQHVGLLPNGSNSVYRIYLTKGQTNNGSTNVVVELTVQSGGDLSDINGNPPATNGLGFPAIPLDIYQRFNTNALHNWWPVGYITNTSPNPVIQLQYLSGSIDDANTSVSDEYGPRGQRWYTDAIRFEYIYDECLGVAGQLGINGPLINGQTFVTVNNVAAGATNVMVLTNNVLAGQTNLAPGFAGGTLTINLPSPLIQGSSITAGQTKNGCSSTVPSGGPVVGGGPNSKVRAMLSLWQSPDFSGPVGANTTSNLTTTYWPGATALRGGTFGNAPDGGASLLPDQCWQTAVFDPQADAINPANIHLVNTDPFAALEGLIFSIDDTNSGPYEIYIDQIKNGDVVIEDFEGYAVGTTNTFSSPKRAESPPPNLAYLSTPNSSIITSANAFDGTKSCLVKWQWADSANTKWAHILANNSTNAGKYYPQISTTNLVTVRYLVLPAGQSTNKLHFSSVPANQSKLEGQNVTFSVGAEGEGPFTYQWQFANNNITDATNSFYTKNGLVLADAGVYSVITTGSGGTGCSTTNSASLSVTASPNPTLSFSVNSGQITLTWNGSFTLQSATNLSSTWGNVTNASGYSESLNSSTSKYFRLVQ